MENKSIWIGMLVGLIIGFIALLNSNNLIGKWLLLLFSFPFLFIYHALTGPCSGSACEDKLAIFVPLIGFIPIMFALFGALLGTTYHIISKKSKALANATIFIIIFSFLILDLFLFALIGIINN